MWNLHKLFTRISLRRTRWSAGCRGGGQRICKLRGQPVQENRIRGSYGTNHWNVLELALQRASQLEILPSAQAGVACLLLPLFSTCTRHPYAGKLCKWLDIPDMLGTVVTLQC